MNKITLCLIALCCTLFLLNAPQAEAGSPGKVATLLARTYCSGSTTAKGYGCWGYFYYRIDRNQNRSGAMAKCKNNCAVRKSTQKSECEAGCKVGLDQETK